MNNRNRIVKALQFHLREFDFEPAQVKKNFDDDKHKYLTFMVKGYPTLNLRKI